MVDLFEPQMFSFRFGVGGFRMIFVSEIPGRALKALAFTFAICYRCGRRRQKTVSRVFSRLWSSHFFRIDCFFPRIGLTTIRLLKYYAGGTRSSRPR